MLHFPIFQQLEVDNYGLYPGSSERPGISVTFQPGLTLFLGANGLGKTTLITIIFRMLTGPFDLPRTTLEAKELGGARMEIKPLNPRAQAAFADRVQDAAANATATLRLLIAGTSITIRRHLKNLQLIAVHVGNEEVITDETIYQDRVAELTGVPSFADWVLLLRSMVFYFEDRRELVWDASAQRHILRMMFLPPADARDWYSREREILRRDSEYRNLIRTLNQLEKRAEAIDKAIGEEPSLRRELASLAKLQEEDDTSLQSLERDADELDSRRHSLRRSMLSAQAEADKQARALEAEKLRLLQQYFPDTQRTAQHLYSLLIAQGHCAVCGNQDDEIATALKRRVDNFQCVVCGNGVDQHVASHDVVSLSKERVIQLHERFRAEKSRFDALQTELQEVSTKYDVTATRLVSLRVTTSDRAKEIARIEKALPAQDKTQADARDSLVELRKALEGDKAELHSLAGEFRASIENYNFKIREHADSIKASFSIFAEGFLAEDAHLKWFLVKETLGETGIAKVEFPSFELEMTGSNFTNAVQRKGPDAVSESQREFIDLAFRMSLMHIGGGGNGGSLIIDAPESSLDAYFVKRAANVLCKFGAPTSMNRLIVASNLISGDLLPEVIKGAIPADQAKARIVNLMDIAVPTAALRDNRAEYQSALHRILLDGGIDD